MVGASHPVALRGPAFLGAGHAPLVLRRVDQRYVEGLFSDLGDLRTHGAELRREVLHATQRQPAVLYQPIHRVANLLVVEALCEVPGFPRLDPAKIESAGMVMRRRLPTGGGHYGPEEAWVTEGSELLGWQALADPDADPDPARRHQPTTGNDAIDAALAARRPARAVHAEATTRLFVTPPEVCQATGRTVLFGVVPTVDPEVQRTRARSAPRTEPADAESVRALLPPWLRAATTAPRVPGEIREATVRVERGTDADGRQRAILMVEKGGRRTRLDAAREPWGAAPGGSVQDIEHFVRMLWQVRVELDAFGESVASRRVYRRLDELRLSVGGRTMGAGEWMRSACEVFVLREPGAHVVVPKDWATPTAAWQAALQADVYAALESRLATAAGGNPSRFSRADARYELRAFIRVRRDDGCPPQLVWTEPVQLFRVARWYESPPEGTVVPEIEIPDITRGFLRDARPNVSFRVPKPLFNLLRNNAPGDFLENKATDDMSGPEFQWICGFNISIVMVIAFILMICFMILLNIVFWWLPFVKICIPLPGRLAEEAS